MWVAKIKFSSEGTLIGSKALKHKVSLFGFPLSFSKEKDGMIVQLAGTLFGAAENKDRFVRELKKNNRVIRLELNDDFLIGIIKDPLYTEKIYNKDIFHLEPALISDEGYELLTLGSFDRKKLTAITKMLEERYSGELISIQSRKINSVSVMKVRPELTEKQRNAMELAIRYGYYNSPRRIDVKSLAKSAKLSFSTFQVHLRKAEEKLMPYYFDK